MNKENEKWIPIKNYEDNYLISNYGQVKNIKAGQILNGDINNIGYRRVILYSPVKKRFFVHRLVAYHFCDGYSDEKVVNHKDGNKLNNNSSNLEWVTRSENDLHAYNNDLRHIHMPNQKGDMYYQVFDYTTGSLIKEYDKRDSLLNDYPMSVNTLHKSTNRGWFYKDWKNQKIGKIGVRKIFRNINNKSSTTIETTL